MAKFGDVVQEFYVERFRANMAARADRLRGVTEPGQARAYIEDARRRVRQSFQLPEHSGEPVARMTGRLQGNGFTVEKLLYESRPGYWVSANYYLPEKVAGKLPAVLFVCGHSATGKAGDTYQMAAQALALCGFAVLIPDPVGQGERGQFRNIPEAEALCRNCTHEHNMYGKQLLLTGEFFGTWRAFDAVRALDWLLARPEVDSTRVGVTGNSGGGTLTTYVNALDDRITMAAPCCYITRWWRHVENELPVDAEQTPPGLAAAGGEMADMLFAAAPRPLLICGQRNDFFDPRGTLECYDELRRVYRILGRENEVECFIGPVGHGLSTHLRERVVAFFCRHAGVELREISSVAPFPEKELWCTPAGNVCDLPENRRIQCFVRERAAELIRTRETLPAPELAQKLRSCLKLGEVAMPNYRVLRSRPAGNEVRFSRFLLETEPGMRVTLSYVDRGEWFHLPERETGKIPLYLPHQSSFDELADGSRPGFALDYRGVGESMPEGCDQGKRDFFGPYQFDYHFASLGLLLDEPYLGGRVRDIMAACLLLNPEGEGRIALTARGVGVVPGVLAALLSDRVAELQLLDRPESLAEVVQAESTPFPQSNMFPGMLAVTDLPDLYRALREKGVRLSGD